MIKKIVDILFIMSWSYVGISLAEKSFDIFEWSKAAVGIYMFIIPFWTFLWIKYIEFYDDSKT